MVDELYLATLGRFPRDDEREAALRHAAAGKEPAAVWQDLLWTLLNTREFMFNH